MNESTVGSTGRSLSVLVAEDNMINQRLLGGILKALGHQSVVVGDGDKALQCLAKLQFDVVLMDVMMPVMDGLEALAAIRAQEQGTEKHLPIIMATAHNEPEEREKFKNAGADGYVSKPIAIESLRQELDRVMANR
jgi:two-component system, sensor histidine kinase and response regulator